MFRTGSRAKAFFSRKVAASLFILFFVFGLSLASQQAFANGASPLVETKWLADNLKNPELRVVHVGSPSPKAMENFGKNHIPGAAYVGIGSLMQVLGNGSAPPDKAGFEALMGKLGISNDTYVILYGSGGSNPFITTAFWLMQYFGHEKASYLNGGIAKWTKDGNATQSGAPMKAVPASYKAVPDEALRAEAGYVLKSFKDKAIVVVDTRSPEEYSGANAMGKKRAGHIPGAVHLNFVTANLNQDGTFKSVKELKTIYEAKGVTKDKEAITYCLGGVRASHSFFVLKNLLGYKNVRNYVGSWGEWADLDPEKYPIEK